ncbi:GNAT family N-acetyltransferase [Billgrantia sp. LNSP4103-1]|uniref:GNAT family N-acetyltransferase n=1 Tax=Billgrantia sp. LNSP4103-1 TaxID=3410266 RepID=UPI00403F57E3
MKTTIRKARTGDAPKLAELMNMAGEGIPAYLWERLAEPGEDVMSYGAQRVARAEGGFSYTNAYVAACEGAIAGMLLGYRLDDPYETGPMEEIPAVVRPLVELEALAPGSWYVNAVATEPAYRGQGIGRLLMEKAEQLAEDTHSKTLSLIVAEENVAARQLYEKLGYRIQARRPIVSYPHCPHTGDWILMTAPL